VAQKTESRRQTRLAPGAHRLLQEGDADAALHPGSPGHLAMGPMPAGLHASAALIRRIMAATSRPIIIDYY
jgi:hypothetical protein